MQNNVGNVSNVKAKFKTSVDSDDRVNALFTWKILVEFSKAVLMVLFNYYTYFNLYR